MQKLYVISTCMRIDRTNAEFHFKGYFNGIWINKIVLNQHNFECYESYLIELRLRSVKDKVLFADIVRYKKLFNP